MDEVKPNAVVTLRNEVSPWLNILQVAPDGWNLPDYQPGQYTTLGLFGSASRCALAEPEATPPPADKLIRRAYSIVSSPLNREYMEFYLNLVPGGVLTPRLFNLKIGDRISLSQRVAGSFTFDHVPEDVNVVLIANGSGLAPYVSMLTTHLQFSTQRRVAVLHGVRHSWDLAYRSTLMTMQRLRTNFTYLPIISRPQQEPVPWTGASGHVQDLWKDGILERAWGLRPGPEHTHVFLCGSPDMIEEMVAMLVQEEFVEIREKKPGQIHVERYWPKKTAAARS
jgi:ferredoxin--NADP+ reductase